MEVRFCLFRLIVKGGVGHLINPLFVETQKFYIFGRDFFIPFSAVNFLIEFQTVARSYSIPKNTLK